MFIGEMSKNHARVCNMRSTCLSEGFLPMKKTQDYYLYSSASCYILHYHCNLITKVPILPDFSEILRNIWLPWLATIYKGLWVIEARAQLHPLPVLRLLDSRKEFYSCQRWIPILTYKNTNPVRKELNSIFASLISVNCAMEEAFLVFPHQQGARLTLLKVKFIKYVWLFRRYFSSNMASRNKGDLRTFCRRGALGSKFHFNKNLPILHFISVHFVFLLFLAAFSLLLIYKAENTIE